MESREPNLDRDECALCGREIGDNDDWWNLEVTGGRPTGAARYWNETFCSQQHGAEWLGRPLPEAERSNTGITTSWWEPVLTVAVLAFVALCIAFSVLGFVVTVNHFVTHWW